VLAERAQVVGEVAGGGQGLRVVLAQDAAGPGQRVLVQVPGGLVLAERAQVDGEAVGGGQGLRVVIAQDAAGPGKRVLAQVPGGLVLAERAQVRRARWRCPGCRWSARTRRRGSGRLRPARAPGARRREMSMARLLAEIRVSGWSLPRRGGGSDVLIQLPGRLASRAGPGGELAEARVSVVLARDAGGPARCFIRPWPGVAAKGMQDNS
jgi:hypothetical protein